MTDTNSHQLRIMTAIIVCLALAAALLIAGSSHGARLGNLPVFAIAGSLPFLLHWLIFLPSLAYRTEHYFDMTGALSFISAILFANWIGVAQGFAGDLRSQLLSLMVLTWSLRLGSFLFLRIKRDGEDRRFREIKTRPLRFFMTWTLSALWVLITVSPALAAITADVRVDLGPGAVIALGLWFCGLLLEVIADRQKSAFKADPANRDRFIRTGLWAISRHPNYLGEILLWIGVALLAAPALQGWQYCTLISPLFVILLLCRVSGIPMLENRAFEKWGKDPEYLEYLRQTPVLIPGIHGKDSRNREE